MGKKRLQTYNPQEKDILSYYQACKASLAYWLGVEFDRISLVKDDFKEEDKEILSKTEMIHKIEVFLAGKIGVEEKFNDKFSNSHLDIKKAKELAIKMVRDYGMGESILSDENLEALKIIEEAIEEVKNFYKMNYELIEKVYKIMQEKEVIHKSDFEKLEDGLF